jgi:hypothetical protein
LVGQFASNPKFDDIAPGIGLAPVRIREARSLPDARLTGQIPFLLRHVSIQTTERYLWCKQELRDAVNDRLGIEQDEKG